ncbi:MAG TPA: hypothetical protein EYP14_12285 [Planctomycetaceae bacterium]|nr:hypothetical protein [Planctomycetaceae bacterium]
MNAKGIRPLKKVRPGSKSHVFSVWERDFCCDAVLQPLEADDTPHGPSFTGLVEPPQDATLRVLLGHEVPTRFLRVTPTDAKGPACSYIVDVITCVRIADWAYQITAAIVQVIPPAAPPEQT